MASRDEIFTNKLFLNAVLPLIKVIANDVPSLAKKFEHAHGVMQVSALDPDSPDGKVATHFVVNCGEWLVHNDKVDTAPHIELEFKSIEAMNAFFKGKMSLATLPKMKGIAKHPGLFASFMAVLLKMSSLLTARASRRTRTPRLCSSSATSICFRAESASSTSSVIPMFTIGRSRAPTVSMRGLSTATMSFRLICA